MCLGISTTQAQSTDTSNSSDSLFQPSNIILPAIGSTPETSLLFGVAAFRQFKMPGATPQTRSSALAFAAIYTLNKQLEISISPALIFPDETYMLNGMIVAKYFPESYWGVGGQTEDSDLLQMEYRQLFIEQVVLKKISKDWFWGPRLRWTTRYDMRFENDQEQHVVPEVVGNQGGISSGLGLMVRHDSRDHMITPSSGAVLEVGTFWDSPLLGSDFNYVKMNLDARKYLDLSSSKNERVWAFQFLGDFNIGDVPVQDMALLGGQSILRGYMAGRFRDQHAIQIQTEIRQHLFWRMGLTAFIAAGEVGNSIDELATFSPKWAGGGGLRFNLTPNDKTNLRIDYGIGPNTSGFYLTIGEAF